MIGKYLYKIKTNYILTNNIYRNKYQIYDDDIIRFNYII